MKEFEKENFCPDLILYHRKKKYTQVAERPCVGVSKETYQRLQKISEETGIPITQIANQAIDFAISHIVVK